MKRVFDFLVSTCGLLLLSPLFFLIAAAIYIEKPGAIFFVQTRVGRDGVPFRIIKFRSMIERAPDMGPELTSEHDSRITVVGRFLRRTKLDELPQLINVWLGEMSLVGPRPEVPSYVALYDERQRKVLSVRPGMTDPASIAYIDEEKVLGAASDIHRTYVEEILPRKLELNLDYVGNMSLLTDLKIICRTIGKIAGIGCRKSAAVRGYR